MTRSEFYDKFSQTLSLDVISWDLPSAYAVKNKHLDSWSVLLSLKGEIDKDALFYIIQDSIWKLDLSKHRDEIEKTCEKVTAGKLKAISVPKQYLEKISTKAEPKLDETEKVPF